MDATIIAIIVAVAAPLGAYLVAARRFSGKIDSSDASELWKESKSIREWSAAEISGLRQTVSLLEQRVGSVESERADLLAEISGLRDTIADLRAEIVSLTEELRKSHARTAELEEEKTELKEGKQP